jgi:hypothetical protein
VKLVELHPELPAPAASTVGDWLRREGVVGRSRQRRRCPPYTQPFAAVSAANDVWCTDFQSLPLARTGPNRGLVPHRRRSTVRSVHLGRRAQPFVLRCQAAARPDEENVRLIFEAAFKEHGLPLAIRSDNGPPFASPGVGGLSRLAVWWIKLGIRPERIVAGKPQQNGRHERVHRTLNQKTATPPAASVVRSKSGSTRSARSTTRSGRTRRWDSRPRLRCSDLRRGPIPIGSRIRTMARASLCAACAAPAR